MKKSLKFFAYIVLALVTIAVGLYLYTFRQQEIEISLIPNEFSYCGKQISGNENEYQEIVSWLRSNKDGWVLSYVSYVPRQVYSHPAFVVNVMDGGVIVSYMTDYGFAQYAKTIEHGFGMSCAKSS
jgi:hypothetical protein